MHPLNPYSKQAPDFTFLCQSDEKLANLVEYKDGEAPFVNFKDADVLRTLTESTLLYDFGIKTKLLSDRLCPPIPNRLNYLAWVEEILGGTLVDECTSYLVGAHRSTSDADDARPVKRARQEGERTSLSFSRRILDIGTGASCIYPLLGSALHDDWEFVGTDVDTTSLDHARFTITDPSNNATLGTCTEVKGRIKSPKVGLSEQVHLVDRSPSADLLLTEDELDAIGLAKFPGDPSLLYHLSMCNPPFYGSAKEMHDSFENKADPPNAVCHGSEGEMVCQGGELAFVRRMIEQSLSIGSHVLWFTTMLGKLADVRPLVEELHARKIDNFAVAELVQGQTKRWALAWSLTYFRLPPPMTAMPNSLKALSPPPGVHVLPMPSFAVRSSTDESPLVELQKSLVRMGLSVQERKTEKGALLIFAAKDSWSRKARRLAKQQADVAEAKELGPTKRTLALTVRVRIRYQEDTSSSDPVLEAFWVYGRERQLFDSFVMSVLSNWAKQAGAQG